MMTAGDPSTTRPSLDSRALRDNRGRALGDLRISLTDRCNFRCTYCMPADVFTPGYHFLGSAQLLDAGELRRLVAAALRAGVRKVRLSGGEPLLRPGVVEIVRAIAELDIADLAMTTNGSLLTRFAQPLSDAGLRRITVSLDSLDPGVVAALTGGRGRLPDILAGIAAAEAAGFTPLKLNCVVRRGVNDGELLRLVDFARSRGHILRFIEFMDVGATNRWTPDEVVPAAEILRRVGEVYPLTPVEPTTPGEVARRHRYLDGGGELGVIASVTEPFCGGCTRLRVSADGQLFTCLFATRGTDIRPALAAAEDGAIDRALAAVWRPRRDAYSEQRGSVAAIPLRRVEMSYIGG